MDRVLSSRETNLHQDLPIHRGIPAVWLCFPRSRVNTVVSQKVSGARGDLSNNILLSELNNACAKIASGNALQSQEVGTQAGDMGSSHRSAGDGVDTAIVPGAGNINTGCVDIDEGTKVGEEGHDIGDIRCANRAGTGFRGWGVVGGVGGGVSGGDGEENSRCYGGSDL